MEPQARLDEFRAWFDRTSESAFEANATDDTNDRQAPADRLSNPSLQLDYLACLEVLCQCRYFGESTSALDWGGTRDGIRQVIDWSGTGAFGGRSAPGMLSLVDRLIYRLDSREDQGFEVPAALVSQFLYLGARADVRDHFVRLASSMDRISSAIVELVNDPNQLATILIGSEADPDLRSGAEALNHGLEFLMHRYELIRALDEWPVVQQSVTVFLNDAAWELSMRGELIERCVSAMQAWYAFVEDEDDRQELEKHIQKVAQSMNGFPILQTT